MIEWRRCKIRLKVLKAISLMVLHAFLFSNIAFATSDIAPSDKLAPYLVTNDEDLEDVERASRQIGDIDGRTLADRYRDVRGAWARRHPIQWIRAHGETPKEGANGSYPLAGVEGALLRARYAQALRTSLEAGGITHNRVAQALNSTRRVLDTFEVNQITPALASARMSATGSLGCRELATPDITDDEAQVARDIAAEAMGRGDCTELDFTDSEYENIRDIISANAPARILPLIDDIRSGNVMLRAVDVYDEDTGMPLFGFPRKRPEDRTIVLFSDIGKDGKLYIYMTRALLVQCLPYFEVSDEERIRGRHAMAEILTYEYGATKLGMSRGELTHITFNFSSDYAKGTTESNLVVKGTGIPDLDRLMLENASRGVFNWESDFDYLTRIVSAQVWDPTKPRAQQFRVAVVEAIQNLLYLNCSEEKVRHDYMTSPTYEVSRAAYNVTHYMYPRRLPGIFGYDPAIPAQTVRSSIYRGQFLAGVADVDIPYEAALRIGRSIAITMMETFPGEKEEIYIAIGRDIRLSSPRIYRAIKEGLLRCGVNVVEIAETHSTVSMASEAMLHPELLGLDGIKRIHGAIAISGTRQPWVYNGIRIKYLSHERKGEGEIEVARDLKGDDLEGLIHRCRVVTMLTRARRGTGDDYAAVGFHENYRGKIKGLVCEKLDHEPGARPLEGMRVALDASHGVCGFYADILEDLGATAVRVNCRPNGYYPGHVPEPHDEAALDYLGVVVRDHSCDMGIIFSSDGGRVAVIDENGQEAPSDDLFKLLIDRETPPGEPSKVVVTPRVSESCRDFASTLTDREVAVVDCGKIGYAHVMDTILAEDAVFGGEDVGKFLLGPDYTDDAVRAASVILSLVKSDPVNRTLSQIVASYPRRVSLVWRIALRINESHARVRDLGGPDAFDNLLEDVLMDAVVANRDADGRPSAFHSGIVGVSTEDGLKIIFDDVTGRYRGWVFIRQSFTEPDRIYVDVEATNE